ncbi:hypothetical protein HK100_007115 [Physocladia obscura]|uniref:Uncharacterized protein n=1 Tax=Physocladia obscura TaxID=109957 RepID=A0AAD5SS17_9FUNG|nr:hypothetical protein HK100_007115 [Physocladia obscura]
MAKTFIITGGSNGIGKETARIIASRHPEAKVIITGRSKETVNKACLNLQPLKNIEGYALELTDFASIKQFADVINTNVASGNWVLASIVHNAGMQLSSFERTAIGIEKTFHANHIGTFYLNKLILDALKKQVEDPSTPCRMIIVSSDTHDPKAKTGVPPPVFEDPRELTYIGREGFSKMTDSLLAYSSSKLCNVLYTYKLAQQLPAGLTVNAFNPSLVPGTGLTREHNIFIRGIASTILPLISSSLGGSTLARSCGGLADLMDSPTYDGVTAKYVDITQIKSSSDWSYDEHRQNLLWDLSEEIVTKHAG